MAEEAPKQSDPEPGAIFRKRKNQRNVVTKLELPNDPYLQQKKIAQNVFDTEYEVLTPARNHSDWKTTDEYFDKAKASYDNVLAPFQEPPKVYKLEKTAGKIEEHDSQTELEMTSKEIEDELDTMLDPYAIPAPWIIKYDRDDNLYYFNPETGGRKIYRPDDVWKEKLQRLEKLVPREDYSGWEYKEDEKERRARLRTQLQFDKKLNEEIKRRQENPTDDEMVEDALYDIIERIERDAQREIDRETNRLRKEQRASWHPSSMGHRMKQLELLPRPEVDEEENKDEHEEPRMDRRITDLDYVDTFVLTDTGFVLPKTRPADLLEIHEAEREEKRLMQEAVEMEEERIRRLPIIEKASMLVTQAIEEGPKEAAKTLAKGIEYRAMVLPRKLKSLDRRVVVARSQEAVVSGVSSLLKITRNPVQTAKEVSSNLSELYRQMFPPKQESTIDMDMLMNELDEEADKAEDDAKRQKAEALAISLKANRIQAKPRESKYGSTRRGGLSSTVELMKPPVKVDLPDCTLVTITLNRNAPAAAVLEHSYGQKMFIKSRDKIIQKSIERRKQQADDQSVESTEEEPIRQGKPPPPEFRHNFKHNDDESPPSSPVKESTPALKPAATKKLLKKKESKKKKKNMKFFDPDAEIVVDSDEEEFKKAKEKLPTFLQDPPKKYNNIARKQFESQLIFDLAIACGIPESYFTIEEVRNLPDNDPKVMGFVERNRITYEKEAVRLSEEEAERKRIALLEQNEMVEFAKLQAQRASVPINKVLQSVKTTTTKLRGTIIPEDKEGIFGSCIPKKNLLAGEVVGVDEGEENNSIAGSELESVSHEEGSVHSIQSFDTENTRDKLAARKLEKHAHRYVNDVSVVNTTDLDPDISLAPSVVTGSNELPPIIECDFSRPASPEKQMATLLVTDWTSEKTIAAFSIKTEYEANSSGGGCSVMADVPPAPPSGGEIVRGVSEDRNSGSGIYVAHPLKFIDDDELTVDSYQQDQQDANNHEPPPPDSDSLAPSPMKAVLPSVPKMPEKFVLGIANPKDLLQSETTNKHNSKYWQAKDIRMLSEAELQIKRLDLLKSSATLLLPDSDNKEGDTLRSHIARETVKRKAKLKLEWLEEQRKIVKQLAKVQLEAKLQAVKEKSAAAMSKLKKSNGANSKAILPPIEPGQSSEEAQLIAESEENERQQSIKTLEDMDHILSAQEEDIKQSLQEEGDEQVERIVDAYGEKSPEQSSGDAKDNESVQSSNHNTDASGDADGVSVEENTDAGSKVGVDSDAGGKGIVDTEMPTAIVPFKEDGGWTTSSEVEAENQASSSEDDEDNVLRSCEVSFWVRVDDVIRSRHEGLAQLTSSDIAQFLVNQLNQVASDLLKGSVASTIVDVRFRGDAFAPRYFTRWEQRWVYLISPVYFGYSSKKSERKNRNKGNENKLPNGLQVKNPVSGYTEDEKVTFMALGGGKLPVRKLKEGEEEQAGPVIDLDVDDIAAELGIGEGSTGPKIYRPNMSQLTQREVEKCKRLYKAFQEVYETQMKRGLVDGKRLRREQYDALKDRDTAKRIYDVAKQKLNRDARLDNDQDAFKPHMTRITDDVFNGWKKELEDDENVLLREKKKKAEEARENRRKMANARKLYDSQRTWMVAKLTSVNTAVKTIAPFGPAFQEELEGELRDLAKLHNPEANQLEVLKIKKKKAAHEKMRMAEEKLTKKFYGNVAMWVHQNAIVKEFKENEALLPPLVDHTSLGEESRGTITAEENMSVVSLGSVEQGWDKEQQLSNEQRRQSIPFRRVSFADGDPTVDEITKYLITDNTKPPFPLNSSVTSTIGSENPKVSTVIGPAGEAIPSLMSMENAGESAAVEREMSNNSQIGGITETPSEFSNLVQAIPSEIANVTTLNTRRNSATTYDEPPRRRAVSNDVIPDTFDENGSIFTSAMPESARGPVPGSGMTVLSAVDVGTSSSMKRRMSAISSNEASLSRKGSIQMNTGMLLSLNSKTIHSVPSVDSASLSIAADAPFLTRKDLFAYLAKAREQIVFSKAKSDQNKPSEKVVAVGKKSVPSLSDHKVPFCEAVEPTSESVNVDDPAEPVMVEEAPLEEEPVESDSKMIEIKVGLDGNADFSDEELNILKQLRWTSIVSSITEFRSCMQTISTEGKNDFTRDELVLFAKLVVDLEPAFTRARLATTKLTTTEKKENRKDDASKKSQHSQSKKKSKHEELVEALSKEGGSELLSASTSTDRKMSRAEGLRRESIRRASNFSLAAARRKMREKAWKTAHQHLYIKMPDRPKYCVVCADKDLESWIGDHDKAEEEWTKVPEGLFEEFLEEKAEENEPIYHKEEEALILAEMEEEAKKKSFLAAEKKRLQGIRRDHILQARRQLYDSVRPMNPLILSQPIKSFFPSTNDAPLSDDQSLGSQTENGSREWRRNSKAAIVPPSPINAEDDMLARAVVQDLVFAMAEAVATGASKYIALGALGFSAGDSLEAEDNLSEMGSLFSSTDESKCVVVSDNKVGENGELEAAPVKIPKYILNSKLALVDPTGMSIIPQEATVVKKGEEKGLKIAAPIADLDRHYLEGIVAAARTGDVLANHLLEGYIAKGFDPQNVKKSTENRFSLTEQFPEISSFDKCAHEILIRVWNKDDNNPNKTGKGDFLGFIILNSADLKSPPKGIRALSLMPDEALSTPKGVDNEILPVTGSLSVKLHATKWLNGTEPNTNKVGFPCEWRLQVIKASKIALVDRNTKTSPFCEIFWRGRAIRADNVEHYSDWLVVGKTTVVERSLDPSWSKEPTAVLELPPRWTECDIPTRGPENGPLTGGGWVAINHVPPDDKTVDADKGGSLLVRMSKKEFEAKTAGSEKTKAISNKFDPRRALRGAVDAVRVASRLNARAMLRVKSRVEDRMKTMKLLYNAEEKERQLMAAEEKNMRITDLALNKIKEEPYVLEQKLFEREFTRLIQSIHEAPRVVARLRFLMASLTSSGGMMVICEDPATKKELDVVSLPLMYEQDENELSIQILELLGTPHKNLVNIVDFSVHQVLSFTFSGSASTNERGALIVMNHPRGGPLSEYMAENWMLMSDNDFRLILLQVVRAVAALHRHKIYHRNLHPDAVTIYNPSDYANQQGGTWGLGTESFGQNENLNASSCASTATSITPELTKSLSFDPRFGGHSKDSIHYMHTGWGSKNASNNKPVCELGDYWFLSNPRKPGCQYSNGRADWGHRHTAPPEVLFAQAITERSDIWAFGICTFHWATEGLYPDVSAGKGGLVDLESLIKKLPLKWGPWLHNLLRMCLQKVPKNRATADDLFRFLTLAKAAKENSTT